MAIANYVQITENVKILSESCLNVCAPVFHLCFFFFHFLKRGLINLVIIGVNGACVSLTFI